jgi:hypothetical protein
VRFAVLLKGSTSFGHGRDREFHLLGHLGNQIRGTRVNRPQEVPMSFAGFSQSP